MKKRHQQKLVILGVVLFFLWNAPFITIFDTAGQLFGFPMLYVFIFITWFVAIIISYIILKKFYE